MQREEKGNMAKEWLNDELGDLAKGVRQALRVWEANRTDAQLRVDYLQKQKEFSKTVRRCKRRHRRERNDRLLQDQRKNPKKFWEFIKNLGKESKGGLPDTVMNTEGECISDPNAVRAEWMNYFQKLLSGTHSPIDADHSDPFYVLAIFLCDLTSSTAHNNRNFLIFNQLSCYNECFIYHAPILL